MHKLLFFLITLILFSCHKGSPQNKFNDPTLRRIYTLQDERSSEPLFAYFKNDTALYRTAAAMAFASVQDTNAIGKLSELLNDKEETVRYAVAFALGQAKHISALPYLYAAYKKESSSRVKSQLLVALGKCGDKQTLSFISGENFSSNDTLLLCGQGWSLFYLGNKKIFSDTSIKKAVELTTAAMPDTVRYAASCFLARARGIDLSLYTSALCKIAMSDKNIYTRMNITRALGKCKSSEALTTLKRIVASDNDARIKINGINALKNFTYDSVRITVANEIKNIDPNVSYTAAEFFVSNGNKNDVEFYISFGKDWRTMASLYSAACKYADNNFVQTINEGVINRYNRSTNVYEKGALLEALSNSMLNHQFIANQTFTSDQLPIHTSGMDALASMRKLPTFFTYSKTQPDIFNQFTSYFKQGMASGDVAMMGISAGILIDTTIALPESKLSKKEILFQLINNDVGFIKKAQQKLQMPRDIETYNDLQATIDFFEGKKSSNIEKKKPENSINWTEVEKIPATQKAIIKTTKGDIIIQLLIENAPGSTMNFIELTKQGFYNDKVFHRVVPNFVIQTGCPRGDGWGNIDYTIRSEFTPLAYDEGFVGMASAGKDTEGCQWFITHSPTPHLNGFYSIFAKVISGMDVVNKIEIGDKIISVELTK